MKNRLTAVFAGSLFLLIGTLVDAIEFDLAAKINGVGISKSRLQESLESYIHKRDISVGGIRDPERYKAMRKRVLDDLILLELLWQDAQKKQLVATDEDVDKALQQIRANFPSEEDFDLKLRIQGVSQEQMREELKRELSIQQLVVSEISKSKEASVSDEEIHAFYTDNPDKFNAPELIHARHILIKVAAQADPATRDAARQRIEAILAEARTPGADFAELAKQYSEGPSGPEGGDLGFAPRGQFVPLFDAAAFALQPGEISSVVETEFGYHVIKLEARRAAGLVPEEEVKTQIRAHLAGPRTEQATKAYAERLREQADIEIGERL